MLMLMLLRIKLYLNLYLSAPNGMERNGIFLSLLRCALCLLLRLRFWKGLKWFGVLRGREGVWVSLT